MGRTLRGGRSPERDERDERGTAPPAASWFGGLDRYSDPVGARRIALFTDLLGRFPAGRLVDLGTGHGIFARVAADLGWDVTGVDARDERFPADPRISWLDWQDPELDTKAIALCT